MPARRITFVTHTAELGGAETALVRLASALDRAAFEPHVVTFGDGALPSRLEREGVSCTILEQATIGAVTRAQASSLGRLPSYARQTRGTARQVADALLASRTDLAVAHSLKAAVLVSIAARQAHVPWVWHLNDRLAADYLPRAAVTGLRALAGTSPRAVIANSAATLATLGRRGRARAVVAYPGLPAAAFADARSAIADGPVGMIGRISQTKGQLEFVEAAGALHDAHPGLRFRIVGSALFGDHAYEQRVTDAVAALPDGLVSAAGWVDDPGSELRALRLLVHASPVPEPFGQVIVEAMAAGVPVIATRAGGAIEILDPHGRANEVAEGVATTPLGILVSAGDAGALARAIDVALRDPHESLVRAEAARASALERFPISKTAAVVQATWGRVLGDAGSR